MRTQTLLTTAKFAKWNEAFETVALPHTWNNLDGQDGGADYHRGACWYYKKLGKINVKILLLSVFIEPRKSSCQT